jgi:hypothetical protein
VRARGEQILGRDHLAADETAGHVAVDRRCGIERGPAAPERPRTGLVLTGGEERDQPERLGEPPHDLVEGRWPVAKLGSLVVRELGELGFELAVDPRRAVLDGEQRLRRQRVELRRKLARPVGERATGVEVREELGQLLELRSSRGVTRLRLLLDALVPALDVVAVRNEQLEPKRLEVVRRRRALREAVEHREDRVHLAQVPEQLGAGARHIDHPDRGGRRLLRGDELGEPAEPVVRDRRHADIGLVGHGRVSRDLGARAGQGIEQRRLAAVREPDDPHFERHGRPA